jgi:hypothetical protein
MGSKVFRVAQQILPASFVESRSFAGLRLIGGQLRMKFHSFEIILPVDKKIIPWERYSSSR